MLFAVILLAGSSSLPTRADTLAAPWRLAELLSVVEARSPELVAARAEQRAAEARIGPVSRPPDPRIQLGLMNRSLPSLGRSSVLAMDQVQLVQMVPVPGKLAAASALARANAAVTGTTIEERRLGLRYRAADDFFEIDRVDRSVATLERTGTLLREVEGVVRAMYSVGSGRQADVLRAQVELARLQEDLAVMRAMRAAAAARLNALLLRAADAPIEAVLSPCLPDSLPEQSALLDAAQRGSPALLRARARLVAAQADRRVAGLERWPDLELGLAYGQQPMRSEPGTERMVSFMVGASLPIWGGSRQGAMRRESDAMAQAAEAELRASEAELLGRIGELRAVFERARRLRELYRHTILPQARATATAALAGYRSGGSNLDTVLESYLTVSQYELQLITLDAEQGRAVASLSALGALDLLTTLPGDAR